MHFIFVYFVLRDFRMKIKCILKIQSKSENPQRSASVRKSHAHERPGIPGIRKFSAYKICWIYSTREQRMDAQCLRSEINTSTSYSGSVGSTFLWFLAGVLFFVSKQQTNRQFLTQRSMRTGELERDTRKKEEKGGEGHRLRVC